VIEAVRDWLAELKDATTEDDLEALLRQIKKHAPQLKELACKIVGRTMEGGEAWAEALFKKLENGQGDTNQGWVIPPFGQIDEPLTEKEKKERPLLYLATPYENAREYVRRTCVGDGGLSGLYFSGGEFWRWNGRFYEKKSEENVRSDVYEFLNGADKHVKTDKGG